MSADPVRLVVGVEFFTRVAYHGDRADRAPLPELPDDPDELRALARRLQGVLYGLQADLTDPQAAEILAGGDGLTTSTWRRVWD